jgi:ribosomal RNA-processing protein 12
MLATALTSPSKQQDASLPPVSHTMLDLLIILIPHLPPSTAVSLFNAASTGNLIENHDAAIQKKCYRILTKLIESEKVASALQGESVDEFVNKLADLSANVGVGAQRVSRIYCPEIALSNVTLLTGSYASVDIACAQAASRASACCPGSCH